MQIHVYVYVYVKHRDEEITIRVNVQQNASDTSYLEVVVLRKSY